MISHKEFDISDYISDIKLQGLVIDRTSNNNRIRKERRIVVLIIKDINILLKNGKLSSSDLLFNPIPIMFSEYFIDNKDGFGKIEKLECSLDLRCIEEWSFKMYGWINPLEDIPFKRTDWFILLDNYREVVRIPYKDNLMRHLEFHSVVPWSKIKFKLAIEYARLQNIEFENITNFDSNMENNYIYRVIYNHMMATTSYDAIPDFQKGIFQTINDDYEIVDIRGL